MAFLDWLPWRRAEQRAITLEQFRPLGLIDQPSVAGVVINESTALNYSAVFNAIDLISSQIASLPRKLYRKNAQDEREDVDSHPVARVVHDEPNAFMTPFVFWQTLASHVLGWGNAYAEIEWDAAMRPIGLWPLLPSVISPVIDGGKLRYRNNGQGAPFLEPEDVLHIPGLGFDGLRGYSVIQMAKQSLGLGVAAERYGAAFFGNGAMPGYVLEHPNKLSADAVKRLRDSVNAMHQGTDKAHRVAIFEEGMKANTLSIPAKDAQFLETREFQVVEVARWFNISPVKLKHRHGDRPGGNLETSQIEFLTDTLRPWLIRIEQECNRKLISKTQRGTYYVEHMVDAILRTDIKARADSYKVFFDMGVLDAEAIARKENFPKPKPKPIPPDAVAPKQDKPALADPMMGDPAATDQAQRALVLDVAGRFCRREAEKARRAAKKGAEEFQTWAEDFYAHEVDILAEMLRPVVAVRLAVGGVKGDAATCARGLAESWAVRSKRELLGLKASNLEMDTEALLQRWAQSRPDEMAAAVAALTEEVRHA